MRAAPRLLIFAALLATAAQGAPARLTEPQIRAFVAQQSKAWNAGDLAGFFGLTTPDATFTDQALARDGRVVTYGTSTVAQAQAQAARFFAKSRTHETVTVGAVQIAPDGRSARIAGHEDAMITSPGRTRRVCANTVQVVVLTPAGLRSKGQTDTVVRCR